ncbi:MAG: bifunctional phosphopantothenoylcysteine decarboxylase/phosphopantothenate--cysteine ligase CoaBC [Deltaproteobacteria bacterium]|nr:bifunctional phosphopantothenoylcysteine decarboxylase/phosphopantothenate--cysteine ligase CoaBC [Deltaproteobacteria bacterium]
MPLLSGKRILLGVGGGISAYKAPELVRRMKDAGADVRVVLTDAGARFVSPLSLEIVSGHPVAHDLWAGDPEARPGEPRVLHTDLGKEHDLIVLAPATANLVGRIRHGLADDLLTTTIMACRTPVLLCPAMNTEMLANPIVRANLDALAAPDMLGRYVVLEPGRGMLACGVEGPGRQPDPPEIIGAAAAVLTVKSLDGLRVLVSAGPTHEAIDPVRVVANRSTGTMGFALARALAARGAVVTLVAGPVDRPTPVGVARRVDVTSASDMARAVDGAWPMIDALVMCAAVADFRPASPAPKKIKKRVQVAPVIDLVPTQDILRLAAARPDRARVALVGFAAETDEVLEYARAKLAEKDLDAIVANDVSRPGVGFGPGDNAGWLVARDGATTELARAPKDDFAEGLASALAPVLVARRRAHG